MTTKERLGALTPGDHTHVWMFQPIPRKDGKKSWVDNQPLSIYGWKKVHSIFEYTYNFMGTPKVNLRPLDRTVGSTPVNGAYVGLDIETFEGTNYLYLEDIEKGHPLYVGGGVLKGCEAMRTNPYSMENE
jgi:hypothetical protein